MKSHLFFWLWIASMSAFAATPNEFNQKVNIKAIRVYAGERPGHFIKVNDIGYYEGCAATKGTGVYYLPGGSAEAYSMLLAAKTSNQKVLLSVKGYDQCHGGSQGHAVVHEVQLGDWN